MRFTHLAMTLALLGAGADLEAARRKPSPKAAPAKAAASKSKRQAAPEVHVVGKGDTGARIAEKHDLDLSELKALNPGVNLAKLSIGQKIRIVAKATKTAPAKAAPAAPAKAIPVTHPQAARIATGLLPVLPELPASTPANLARLERMLPSEVGMRRAEPVIILSEPSRGLATRIQPVLTGDPNLSPVAELGFTPADPLNLDFLWPVETRTKSSFFGPRMRTRTTLVKAKKGKRPKRIKKRYQGVHQGIDLNAPQGTDVYAAMAGRVVESRRDKGYGNFVVIDHGNGVRTLYGHNTANLVQVGDLVRRGQKIALVGSTGHSTGPHVHFEVILNGTKVNPEPFLNAEEEIPDDLVAHNQTLVSPSRR